MTSRRKRKRRQPSIREQCAELLRFILVHTLLERVPLPDILTVTQTDCEVIVDAFTVEHAADIEEAIIKVESQQVEHAASWVDGHRNVTDVGRALTASLLMFARGYRDFLDNELSPYAGL